jgi:hypothetical protein
LHQRGFTNRQADTAGRGADLDRVLLTCDLQRAVLRVEVRGEGRTANTDQRGRCLDLVVVVVTFADQPGDGAQTALDQVDEITVGLRVVAIGVFSNGQLAGGLQRDQPAVAEAYLRPAVRAGDQGVAAFDAYALDQRKRLVPASQADIADGELHRAGDFGTVADEWVTTAECERQCGEPDAWRVLHGESSRLRNRVGH